MLSKESKIRVLENFYAMDYVLFGKPVTKIETCCPEVMKEYLSVKGALLSVVIEMMKLVGHQPTELTEKINSSNLKEMARSNAKVARENCQKLVTSEKGRESIKAEISETIETSAEDVDIESMVKAKIQEKSYRLAIDNLLVARMINESEKYTKLNEWEGRIVEDAYKILRDSLVECAMLVLDGNTV